MSELLLAGDGEILGTHVSWNDIEAEMQKAYQTSASFGMNRSVQAIGEGIGFFSRICLIHADWQTPSPDLPKKFVVKITKQLTMNEEDGDDVIRGFLDRESAHLLRTETNSYKLFNKYGDASFAIGKMLGYRCLDENNKTKGFFIMEHIENVEPINFYDNISLENCRDILKVIAKWQAVSLKHASEFEQIYETHFLTKIFGKTVCHKTCSQSVEGLASISHPRIDAILEKLRAIVDDLCTEESLKKFDELPELMGMKRVFNHFDLWSANVLWSRKQDGHLHLEAVIDYQLACLASPMTDFLMFLICSVHTDMRRAHTKQLIRDFHEYLTFEMEGKSPFTIEQLEESYQRLYPLSVLLICGAVGPIYHSSQRENPSDSLRIHEVFEQKFISVFEDVIQIHELNKKMYP